MAETSWKGTGRKWTLKSALAVGPIELMKMTTPERAELAQFLRNQYILRLNSFKKAGTTGYAIVKLQEDMADVSSKFNISMNPTDYIVKTKGKKRVLSPIYAERKNPQNSLATYVTLMQDFFNAKSSTVKGWREIGEEQDRRLFGERVVAVKGRSYKNSTRVSYKREIAYRMTDQERINFWKVYREITKTGWTTVNTYSSSEQKEFAAKWTTGGFNHLDFEAAYERMAKLLSARPDVLPERKPGIWNDPTQPGEEGGSTDYDTWG